MSTEPRKLKRGARAVQDPRSSAGAGPQPQDALQPEALRGMALRIALIVAAVWIVCGMIAGFAQSTTTQIVMLSIAGAITVGLVAVVLWAMRRAKKARGVASILAGVASDQDREQAISKLESQFKANDPAAVFAKAQLQMQSDPKQALATLEQLELGKLNAAVADEARAQRGMIHLMLGEPSRARDLADAIDLTRHQDARSKAMMSSVIGEAWARTGQAKKAVTVVEVFNPEDEAFEQVRPQLLRARAFAYAYSDNPKAMRRALRRLLGGFLVKKTHPLLQREARQMLERSGQMPRKMQVVRQ